MDALAAAQRRIRTFRLEDELWAGLERIKERDGVSIGEQVRRAIRQWLEVKRLNVKTPRKRGSTRRRG